MQVSTGAPMREPRDHPSEVPTGETALSATKRTGIAPGTLVVALLLVTAIAAGGAFSALVNYDLVGLGHLPRCAVFAVFVLLVVNAVWTKLFGRRPFSRTQLGFIYVAILVMAGIPGQQLVTYLYIGMVGSQYYAAGQGNNYTEEVLPYIKPWMVPPGDAESDVVSWAFHGVPWGASIPWQPWVKPLLAWTPYLLALFALQICIAALLRERWDQERLTYPLAQVPVELVTYESQQALVPTLLRNRLFWGFFIIPVLVHTKNALSFYYPDIRPINLNNNIGALFGTPPWTNFDYLPIMIYFETIGATYLIPVATGLSLWSFWILRRFIYVYRDQRGLMNHQAYLQNQGIGAYFLLAVLCLWSARASLSRAVKGMWPTAKREERDRESEPMHPRWALWGAIISLAVIIRWGQAAGGDLLPVLLMVLAYLAGLIVLSRLVAESGLFCVWTPISPPQELVARAWPKDNPLSNQSVTALCYMGWKIQDTASATMANVMQGYKIAEFLKLRAPTVLWLMIGSIVLAMLASHPPSIYAIYDHGIHDLGWWPRGAAEGIASTIHNLTTARSPLEPEAYWAMGHGALIVAVLTLIRSQFHRFPLQAFAYACALGPQWMMDRYGFSIFLGWIVKYSVLKYGDVKLHNRLRPAAFGLIAGNACVLLFWTIYHYFQPIDGVLVIE